MAHMEDIRYAAERNKAMKNAGDYNCVVREFKHATRVCVYDHFKNVHTKDVRNDNRSMECYQYAGLMTDEAVNDYLLERDKNAAQISIDDINDYQSCGVEPPVAKSSSVVRYDNIKRSKDKLLDICYNNDFTLFVTLTVDDSIVDGYSTDEIYKVLYKWLKATVKTYGLRYVLVPERHKSGRIHFHGLFAYDRPLVLERAYSKKTGKPLFSKGSHRPIFNLPRWKYGYTTAIPIDDNYIRTVRYISKYITKDTEKIFGKRYFSGGKIYRDPICVNYEVVDYDACELREYSIPNTNRHIKYDIKYEEKVANPHYNADGSIK